MTCARSCVPLKGVSSSRVPSYWRRTLQSTVESGVRAGYDGHKRQRGSKVHRAVDTLGHWLAAYITPASKQEREQVEELAHQVQTVSGEQGQVADVDQVCTGQMPRQAAQEGGIDLQVVKLEEARHGLVLLPKRWLVERGFAWASRFCRLARDYERLPQPLTGIRFVVFAILMLPQAVPFFQGA